VFTAGTPGAQGHAAQDSVTEGMCRRLKPARNPKIARTQGRLAAPSPNRCRPPPGLKPTRLAKVFTGLKRGSFTSKCSRRRLLVVGVGLLPFGEGGRKDGPVLRGLLRDFPLNPVLRPAARDCVLGCHDTPYGLSFLGDSSVNRWALFYGSRKAGPGNRDVCCPRAHARQKQMSPCGLKKRIPRGLKSAPDD